MIRGFSGTFVPPRFSVTSDNVEENRGFTWWARQGLNLRPLRCERKRPQQIRAFFIIQRREDANLCGFRSLCVHADGTNRTKQEGQDK